MMLVIPSHPVLPRRRDGVTHTDGDDDSELANTAPLNAGSRWNVLKITYTVTEAEKMAGGLVRIRLPGWAMGTIAEDAPATMNVVEKDHYKNVSIVATPYLMEWNRSERSTLEDIDRLYDTNSTADQQTIRADDG